jgi:nitrite reductase/ring-hydroxylating ferredoxin subunit
MARVKAAAAEQLPPGALIEVEIEGTRYAVCNVEGEVRALAGLCPHRSGPLGHGALHGDMVVCPWHAWEFDSSTGQHDYDPSIRVECFPAAVENGEVFIEIP